jgi:hypothetical protein
MMMMMMIIIIIIIIICPRAEGKLYKRGLRSAGCVVSTTVLETIFENESYSNDRWIVIGFEEQKNDYDMDISTVQLCK